LRAVILRNFSQPLEYVDVDKPINLEKDEVIIKQDITGVCFRDILTAKGLQPRVKLPIILGHEIAGKVVAKGNEVKNFQIGDDVCSLIYIPDGTCKYCRIGLENLCRNRQTYGEDLNGGYAEYVKVNERSLILIPKNVPIEAAVIASCVTGMLVHAIKPNVKENDNVLVTGAGGGVGIHAVQIAKAYGARVIAVTSSEWKAKKIKEVGVDEIIITKDKFSEDVKSLTNKEGVDIVIETVGQPTFEQSFRSVKWGGKVIIIGNVNAQSVSVALGSLILREVSIIGNYSSRKLDVYEALKLTSEGKIVPIIHSIYPLSKANEVHEMMLNKSTLGRALLSTKN
jgi:Zn-dependent alcohol dehydrogenases